MLVTKVILWKKTVGALLEDNRGKISFQFDPAFIKSGLNISPLYLPLSNKVYSFDGLHRSDAFLGLPGVFADSLPDKFGNKIINKYFENKGQQPTKIKPLQRLLYIGKKAMGALEYEPQLEIKSAKATEAIEISALVKQARKIIKGDINIKAADIMQIGASAGGARSKAIIGWNKNSNEVIAGNSSLPKGYEHWLIKFDKAGDTEQKHTYNRAEYVYSILARKAKIEMTDTHLLEENGRAHFMTKRFDRIGNKKVHMHSLAGLTHTDYNIVQSYSYEQFFRTIINVVNDYQALEQGYRRMLFNIVGRNQDDHVKNFAFLMNEDGTWRLSPAFDLTYANGAGWTKEHQMTFGSKGSGFTKKEILETGKFFSIKKPEQILEEVQDAFLNWQKLAKENGVNRKFINEVAKNLRNF